MLAVLLVWLSLALCSVANAQDAVDEAGLVLQRAVRAYERGDLAEAAQRFEQAHALQPTARTLRGLGVVAYRQGRNAAAYSLLTQSLSSTEKPLTEELRIRVQALLGELEAKVARVLFRLEPEAAVLQVDGDAPARDANGAVVLEPGAHRAHLHAEGFADADWDFVVVAGSAQQRSWRLARSQDLSPQTAIAPALVDARPVESLLQPTKVDSTRTARLRRAAYGSLAVAGAGLVASAVAIGLGVSRVHAIESACRRDGCTESGVRAESERARLELLSGLAIGAGIVTGIATISGTWTLVAARRSGPALHVNWGPVARY